MKKCTELTCNNILEHVNYFAAPAKGRPFVTYSKLQAAINNLEEAKNITLGHMSTSGVRRRVFSKGETKMIMDQFKDIERIPSHVKVEDIEKDIRREYDKVIVPEGTVLKYFIFKHLNEVPRSAIINKLRDLGGFTNILDYKEGTLKTLDSKYYAPRIGVINEERLKKLVDYMAQDTSFNKKYNLDQKVYDELLRAFQSQKTKTTTQSQAEAIHLCLKELLNFGY